jgi:small-conductance mechanosensitive channel
VVTALLLGALSACTNIKDDSQRTRTEGALTGAAAGAALGAGAGALLKKNKEGAIAGAAAGALVGGLAGAAVGDAAAKKKEGYAQQESALDSQLVGLNGQIEGRKTYNAKLREQLATRETQLAAVLASDRSAGPTVQEFDLRTSITAKIGEVDRAARSWQETIDAHKTVLKAAGADPRSPELETEINRLAEERAELLRQRARLISINEKLGK